MSYAELKRSNLRIARTGTGEVWRTHLDRCESTCVLTASIGCYSKAVQPKPVSEALIDRGVRSEIIV